MSDQNASGNREGRRVAADFGVDGTETVARREDHRAGSTQRVGRFDVSSVLGSGAFGDVYLARDPQLQREVALKVPRKGSFRAGEEAERFMREARSAAALQHPNICPVHEVFEEDDHFVIVMGYIRGRRLDQFFEPGKPLPELQAARVVARLAKAMQYAHDKGIIHRDLKPANIIVDADRKEPVIMDFGLARREDSGDAALTRSGDILGSPAYMSPEQARGRVTEIGPHSDIYSLGVILYELLCGERPFGGSVAQVIGCILHVETPPPSTRHAGIDAELEAICLKAMSKEKSDRYGSMGEFAAALSQWVKRQRGSSDDAGAVSQAGDIVESRQRAADSGPAGSRSAGSGTPGSVPDAASVSISPFETVPSADVSAITATVAREDAAKVAREEAAPASVVSEHEASGRVGARRRTGRGGVFSGRRGLLIGLAGAAVLLAATVFSIRTPKGTVQFTLTDPTADITITVDGSAIDVKTPDQTLHLEVGEHELKVTAPGFETVTQNFTVRKGQNPALEITLFPDKPPAATSLPVATVSPSQAVRPADASVPIVTPGPPVTADSDQLSAGDERSDNALSMKLVWCPAGSFTMGSPASEAGRGGIEDQVPVTLSRGFWLGKYEVTQGEFQRVMDTSPWSGKSWVKEGDRFAASYVTHDDALEFCLTVTASERAAGRLSADEEYRLPTEAEWEYACRAGTTTAYIFSDNASRLGDYAWFDRSAGDVVGEKYAHEVGLKRANAWGLHDIHGNVWESCSDFYSFLPLDGGTDPRGPSVGTDRVIRGGSWYDGQNYVRSAVRWRAPGYRSGHIGFRVARSSVVPVPMVTPQAVRPVDTSVPIVTPGPPVTADPDQLSAGDERSDNALSMKLVWCPAGSFTMGSPASEAGRDGIEDQVPVTLSRGFWLGKYEVTQSEYRRVMETSPWSGKYGVKEGDRFAASYVTHDDALEFCLTVTASERAAGRLSADEEYRLPTEAEWEYACRADTTTAYCFSDNASRLGDFAWFEKNAGDVGEKYAHEVGLKQANAWGLHDLHGNVREWCSDFESYQLPGGTDPRGPSGGSRRVYRGGSWYDSQQCVRSAFRGRGSLSSLDDRDFSMGFRMARSSVVPVTIRDPTPPVNPDAGPELLVAPFSATVASASRAAWAKHLGSPVEHTNSIGMTLKLIPAGEFLMGSPSSEIDRVDDEGPQHRVRITQPFYLQTTEVTQGQWESVMGTRPWSEERFVKEASDYAATYVSWDDAVEFSRKLSLKEGVEYRLPSEAEWEYACRAGSITKYSFGEITAYSSALGDYAWFKGNADGAGGKYAHRVGQKRENCFGLYDLHGNVWEWCSDWFGEDYYASSLETDPRGPSSGVLRVYRGGSWNATALNCRSADRGANTPDRRLNELGFRVLRSSVLSGNR